ncbi:MAG TPA: hypothetical protein VFV93_04330 [Thermomicrobiales bacterium]|nr:hypothetical protein [Thermomicrobiales bacterium]
MRENELADLLIRMAADRGIEVDAAAEELASFTLPSFVDSRSFRAAVIQSLEQHLRAQVEERLQSIRRRFDSEPQKQASAPVRQPVAPPVSPPPMMAEPAPRFADPVQVTDATIADIAAQDPPSDNTAADEELPTDATMVWTTRHG